MCGNSESGVGIIAGLIAAAAMLVMAFADRYAHAAPARHTISAPVSHITVEMRPVTLDIDIAHARATVNIGL